MFTNKLLLYLIHTIHYTVYINCFLKLKASIICLYNKDIHIFKTLVKYLEISESIQ